MGSMRIRLQRLLLEPAGASSVREALRYLRRRWGVYLNRARRSIWIHGAGVDDFAAADELIRHLKKVVPTDRFVFTSRRAATCTWLADRYPNDNALPLPPDVGLLVDRFFRQLNPQMLVELGARPAVPPGIQARARAAGLPVLLVDARCPLARTWPTVEPAARRIAVPPDGLPDRTAPRRMDRLARSALGRRIVATRTRRRIPDWDSLRARLGEPRTILCLGNGPSSEDQRLRDIDHDCLFRVNWRWLARGFLTRPDMVFVGDLRTPAKISSCIFGFRTVAWEAEVLLRHLLLDLSLGQLEHFTLERVPSFLNERTWRAPPTNGAVMVVIAAALEPARLVIAGMDLYLHPAGRYPGDRTPENEYPQMHDREVELEILDRALSSFRGELVLVGDSLGKTLAAYQGRTKCAERGRAET